MKRILPLLMILLLVGCGKSNQELEQALELRNRLESGNGCGFSCTVTAEYDEKQYRFGMDCVTDPNGSISFMVTEPETIAGITGSISSDGEKLTFDDIALAFDLMADDQISPVSVPWLMIRALQSGYLSSCGKENGRLRVSVYDSYQEHAAYLEIWLNASNQPEECEIFWEGQRILSLTVTNFAFL